MSDDEALARIEHALRRLDDERHPPEGWEERVLHASARPRARRSWRTVLVPLAAAAGVLLLWRAWPARQPAPLALTFEVLPGERVVRGPGASVGDTVRARVLGGSLRALWIYRRDDELLLACPGHAGCRAADGALEASLELAARGDYSMVALTSAQAIPAPTGHLDADVSAAAQAGADYRIEALTVR